MPRHLTILTKATIRESALNELRWRGCTVWIQNNLAVRGRKFIGRKGVADIIGWKIIDGKAVFLACEIKTNNDRLSIDQIDFLTDVKSSGGVALLAVQSNTGQVILKDFIPEDYG
jgi:hypothetical protein